MEPNLNPTSSSLSQKVEKQSQAKQMTINNTTSRIASQNQRTYAITNQNSKYLKCVARIRRNTEEITELRDSREPNCHYNQQHTKSTQIIGAKSRQSPEIPKIRVFNRTQKQQRARAVHGGEGGWAGSAVVGRRGWGWSGEVVVFSGGLRVVGEAGDVGEGLFVFFF
ncbi:hypothetical protein RND81_07G129900 [Saponaria officinalis]|uniref:Uncharacterized protein n=1 Tax=Saponaria officinalis TaxID=3572 RepID=A0AAW1JQ49_SAPOF